MKVGTVLSDEGKTRIVPYKNESKIAPLEIEFFEEKWASDDKRRAYVAVVKFREHKVQISEFYAEDLVRRLGHVLLALTEDIEQ